MIPWFSPKLGKEEIAAVKKVIESNYPNEGTVTREFENQIAKLLGVEYCVSVPNGTLALSISLMALGIGHNDEVIVPNFTFIATANAVRMVGAKVVLADIEPDRLTIDPSKLDRHLTNHTKAIITVDVNGRGAYYDMIEPWAKKKGLFLITDSTEGLGSCYQGRPLGSFGQTGCFSFSANKTITAGQGGMISTNERKIYKRLIELKNQGRPHPGNGGNDTHPTMGFNFKFTNLQAAIGLAQLKRLPGRLEKSKKREKWYREFLRDSACVRFPVWDERGGEITQWTDILSSKRDNISRKLKREKIDHRLFWYPLNFQKPYYAHGQSFPLSYLVSKEGMWLPSSFDITKDEVEKVCRIIKSVKYE